VSDPALTARVWISILNPEGGWPENASFYHQEQEGHEGVIPRGADLTKQTIQHPLGERDERF
jgi:hypothetical protein